MSRLESKVGPWLKPAILGEETVLAMPQQRVVAFWAIKTALLFESAMRKFRRTAAIPEQTLRSMYDPQDERMPPPDIQVWIAKCDPNNPPEAPERFRVADP